MEKLRFGQILKLLSPAAASRKLAVTSSYKIRFLRPLGKAQLLFAVGERLCGTSLLSKFGARSYVANKEPVDVSRNAAGIQNPPLPVGAAPAILGTIGFAITGKRRRTPGRIDQDLRGVRILDPAGALLLLDRSSCAGQPLRVKPRNQVHFLSVPEIQFSTGVASAILRKRASPFPQGLGHHLARQRGFWILVPSLQSLCSPIDLAQGHALWIRS